MNVAPIFLERPLLQAGLGFVDSVEVGPTPTDHWAPVANFFIESTETWTGLPVLRFDEMLERGTLGFPVLDPEQWAQFVTALERRDGVRNGHWLEAPLLADGSRLLFPQDDSPEPVFSALLPVRFAAVTALVTVATPQATDPASVPFGPPTTPPVPCIPGVDGGGQAVCVGGSCTGSCDGRWQDDRGHTVLVGCDCHP